MIKEFKMKFPLSISTTRYDGKCKDWGRVTYRTEEVDIDSLAEYVKQGFVLHTFSKALSIRNLGHVKKPYQISIRHMPCS